MRQRRQLLPLLRLRAQGLAQGKPPAPIQNLSVPQEGKAQGPMAHHVPTERGLASASIDGQDPPTNDKGIRYRERVVSVQERGGIIITVIIICT